MYHRRLTKHRVTRAKVWHCIIIDTRDFSKPVAVIQMPMYVKAQVHGAWVEEDALAEVPSRSAFLKPDEKEVVLMGRGSLAFL